MTDNEIIKALGCHADPDIATCKECPYDGNEFCGSTLYKDTLDLINRQKAEIERLKCITTSNPYCVSIGTADIFTANHEEYEELLAKISAEAIKEFAERLKGMWTIASPEPYNTDAVEVLESIDNLVKEMVGESNGNQ